MYLSGIASHIASDRKQVDEFFRTGEISQSELNVYKKIMGLKQVPREKQFTVYDQMNTVMTKLRDEYSFVSEKIKYIFFSHTGDIVFPLGFEGLKKIIVEFGLTQSFSFGSTLHKCASAFQFMRLSKKLFHLLNDDECIILLIADSAFTEILRIISGSTILGDAATAILLKKKGTSHQLIDVLLKNYGEFSKGIWAEESEKLLFQANYIKYLSQLILEIVNKNNISVAEVKCIFPHNVNLISWKQVIRTLSLNVDQVYLSNIEKTAHCFGSDPFFNLKDGIAEKRIVPGDYYLLVTMGLGATFGALLFQY